MKSKLFSSVKQFWQLIIYKRHFLSQEETEAVTDFRFSILIFWEQINDLLPGSHFKIWQRFLESLSISSRMTCHAWPIADCTSFAAQAMGLPLYLVPDR